MKVSIIGGAGRVGASIAFSLLHSCKPEEIVLVDIMKDAVMGEAIDLGHAAVALSPGTKVEGTDDFSRIRGSKIVIITAGRARKPDETREQLFDFNKKIVEGICGKIAEFAPGSHVIVVTNPSTRLGKVAQEATGFPKERIIIMDNQLDTARLRYYISKETGRSLGGIKSYAAGEHGEAMEFEILDNIGPEKAEAAKKLTREAGLSIIKLKGYTCWGIASQVAKEVARVSKLK